MIPIVLDKRKSKIRSGQVFNKLLSYIEGGIDQDELFESFEN